MSSALEQKYRSTLGWYPKTWRAQNEEIVLGTLLDVAESENRSSPRMTETLNLAWNGVATRLGVFLPAAVRHGVASIALGTGTAFAVLYLFFAELIPFRDLYVYGSYGKVSTVFGPFADPGFVLCGLWMLGFVFAMLKLYKIARILLGFSILVSLIIQMVNFQLLSFEHWHYGPSTRTLCFFSLLAILGLLGTARNRLRLGIAAGIALTVLLSAYAYFVESICHLYQDCLLSETALWDFSIDQSNTLSYGLLIALLGAIGFAIANRQRIAVIIAVSTLPWIALWIVSYASWWRFGLALRTMLLIGIVVTALIALFIVILLQRRFEIVIRRLPAYSDSTTTD